MVQRYVDSDPWKREVLNAGSVWLADIATTTATASATPGITVWPNPVHETMWISGAKGMAVLTDVQGRTLMSQYLEGRTGMNLSQLPAGIYFLQVQGSETRAKVVVD
jgi:hypothetical protein